MLIRSKKIRNSAKGKDCTLCIDGVCNENPETTILAHLKTGVPYSGVGLKTHDIFSAYSCSSCHDFMDMRTRRLGQLITEEEYNEYALYGMTKTLMILINEGILLVK